ncbi:hypothetical protein AN672_27675, partial [Citrobacter freundii]
NMGKTIAMMKTITHRQRQLIVILLLPTLVTTKPELPNRAQMLRVKLLSLTCPRAVKTLSKEPHRMTLAVLDRTLQISSIS